MIKHVVLFQLKTFASETKKVEKLNEIKSALEALPQKVDVIRSLEVGLNANEAEEYDIALSTTFDSMEDLDIYAKHPDHVTVGGIIKAVLEKRACVDFEC
ncbi:Dabb family protein [Labilibacter sediminis]|nr:Dabb family protein [Labilibacter sediminis]